MVVFRIHYYGSDQDDGASVQWSDITAVRDRWLTAVDSH